MWYLKVSSSLLIAVALICMIQNVISLTIDPKATEDQWSTLESSTDQNDLKKISKLCNVSLKNFKEKLENTKTIANKRLPEPNKTTDDIANLVSDIKNQVKNASADLVTVRKLVQKTALRFRDTFKSLVSFTELESESVNKELESIKKTTVDIKKPLVNRVIRSFGNRYDLNKLANKVLGISSDREKLKDNYDKKKKIAKKEFNSLWNSLSNHSKTVNDNALKALDTFFEGIKSVKSVKKKVKTLGEDAMNEIKVGDDFIKLKNSVELAKSLKLKFEDEWDLDSGELTYSEEQKTPNTKATDDDQSDVQKNEKDKSNQNISTNNLEPGLPTTEQEPIENDKSNVVPPTQAGVEKLPIMDNRQTSDKAVSPTEETQLGLKRKNKDVNNIIQPTISETPTDNNVSDTPIEENTLMSNTENKDKTSIVQSEFSKKDQNSIDDDDSISESSIKETSFNPEVNNNKVRNTPLKDSIDNNRGKRINKITRREKTVILPWEKLIQLDNPHVSQQSMKCESLLNNVTPDFDNIKKAVKNSIQVTKNYKNLQNIENDTVKQFYDKMVDTNTKLCDYLVNAADDVCAKVTPINKRYETKFKNDPNIKRIKYLLGKQYDPNQYILKVLDDANHKNGIGGMKKTTYYKMLAVAHNLNHETKEMENAALYAMNKIYEGKLAATKLREKFNKEKASKACYIRNILLEKENEYDKKNKNENKEKVKDSINEDTDTEPLKPDVNLDSVDAIQPTTVNDDNEPIINNGEDTKTLSKPNELTNLDNQNKNADKTNIKDSNNTKESMGQGTQEPNSSSIPQDKDEDNNINTSIEKYGNNKAKRNITRKITHHIKHRNPNDPNDVSEEYDTIEEIDDEEDESNESKKKLETIQNEIENENPNKTSGSKISEEIESLEQEGQNELNKSGKINEETDKGNTSVKPKVKRYIKRINPKDGKEITEEYETSKENDINSNEAGVTKSNETPESELIDNADNEHDTETPEHLDDEKVDSNEENGSHEEPEEGSTSVKPKAKRYRKRIDPKDGKEITEEYETSKEDDINPNEAGVTKSNEAPESELLDNADNEHDTETPEHLDTEKVDSNEENGSHEEPEEGNTSVKTKAKRYRKRIDPKDGKEITEEYETSDKDDINPNEAGVTKSNEAPESELIDNADKEHDTETPEHLNTKKVDSNEENGSHEEPEEGSTSVKPKAKRYRKRIDPKDGKEITEEYETSKEDDINLNEAGVTKSNEAPESELLDNADKEHDTETPEHLNTEKVDSNEENGSHEEPEEGSTSVKPKAKRYRKRIDPKDGKEITEEYETSKEDDINLNEAGVTKSNEAPESELLDNADKEHDTETPEHLNTEKVDSNEEIGSHEEPEEGSTSVKPKAKRYRKRIDPKDGKEITEEYETSKEDDINPNEAGVTESNEAPESELIDNADNEHDTETPEHLDDEKVDSNEENGSHEEPEEGSTSVKPKAKRYRKRIDPKDGKEITEEYETSKEDDINPNEAGVTKSNEAPESELLDNADKEHDTETPEHLNTEKVDSNEENGSHEEPEEGSTSVKPKVKRYRKRIDPKDGKEITEEYETSKEDDINPNEAGVTKSNEAPESELIDNADNEHDTETPEHLDDEKIDSNEENGSHGEPEEGSTSVKPKAKRYRKRIDPKDGKEITEEYETSKEDDINPNEAGVTKSNEAPESELIDNADNEHDTETPEHLDDEKVDSNEENGSHEEPEEGSTSVKPKAKRYRKRIDPKDGKEITEEYETSKKDDINPNEAVVTKSNEAPESELLDYADKEHDTETPEHLNTEKIDSNEENGSHEEPEEGSTSVKPKAKRYRKRIDPKDGKEITEEYETSKEDDINPNEAGVTKSNEAPESELIDNADNEHDTETPEHLDDEKVDSNEENGSHEEPEEGSTSVKPKAKRYRKRIDPKDGKEITEEYETSKEDDINPNEAGVTKSNEAPESELIDNADNEHDTETPEHLDDEKVDSNEENGSHEEPEEGSTSVKPKAKRYRKIIDPKDGKEITEEYETSKEDDINPNEAGVTKSNEAPESELIDNADNEHDTETPEHLDDEKVDSNEENGSHEEPEEGSTSVKPKAKRYRKRIDPKDGKEITEEYETSKEDDINPNEAGVTKSNEAPESEVLDNADNEHDTETPEHLDTEKVDSNEENATHEEPDEESTSVKPKAKRYRKRIDPKDGKEITEEYETSKEDDINPNEAGVTKSNEAPESEVLDNADNEHDTETPEHLDTEKVDSNEENATHEEPDEESTSVKPKAKRYRKRIDPKDGKEITEEYETSKEDDINPNEAGVTKSNEAPESELIDNADNQHDTETPEHLNTEKIDSNEENGSHEEPEEGSTSVKPKAKRYRKRIDPKDGKEITEEYETSKEDDINPNEAGVTKSNEAPESELIDNADNEHDTETPEHLDDEKVDSNEENGSHEEPEEGSTSVKPKAKRYRKRIDPKDGKEITEEYETSKEDDINPNEAGVTKSNEAPESEVLDNADNEHDTETPEHLDTEKVDSNEENATHEEPDEESTSVKPKAKRYRKRIDPKDGKEITDDYETSNEEKENKPNEMVENESDEVLDPDMSNNDDDANDETDFEQEENDDEGNLNNNFENENESGIEGETKKKRGNLNGEQKSPINEYDINDDLEDNDDNSREFKSPPSKDNEADVDAENITRETDELDENENLNSVEGAELNGVDNDNIIPAADSMGEDSSSVESSYEEPEQIYLNDSNNTHKNNNEQNNSDVQPKKISKGHRMRKDPKNGRELSEEYETAEEREDESPVASKNNDTPSRKPDGESTDHESETPEYEDNPDNEEIPENYDSLDHKQTDEHNMLDENEPERRSNEEINKTNDIDPQNYGSNQPNKKVRRHRNRNDPNYDQEISEEFDTIEEEKDESPVVGKNIDTPSRNPDGRSTDHESETPEYEDIAENKEIPENDGALDRNQANEHEVIDENEPERRSNEEINKSNEFDQQTDDDYAPNKKMRRQRKRRDPKDGQEISDEYDAVEEREDESPVASKNNDTPSRKPDGESTDHESETPEYEDNLDNEDIPEHYDSLDQKQTDEHNMLDENEPERRSNEEINKTNDIDPQNYGSNQPNKKVRRHRNRNDPNYDQEISEEFDTIEEEKDESPVVGKNIDTPSRNPDGGSTDHESETPEYEDIAENKEIPENDGAFDRNQANEHEVIDENEPERRSNEEINKSNEFDQQTDDDYAPNKKMRRQRKRRDPKDGQEISDEYDAVEEREDESPVASKNNDTPSRKPDGESTDHESETPEYEDNPDNEDISENDDSLDQKQTDEHNMLDENEPERRSNEEINKTNDIDPQNYGSNQPNKKVRRHRNRNDPNYDQEISEEFDTIEEEKDESPVVGKNIDTPSRNPDGGSTDHESETPEYEDIAENKEIPENDGALDRNQANEHEVIDENEPERRSNEEINKSNEFDQQTDDDYAPNKKMRRQRKRRDPKDGQEISDEYDAVEEREDESPVASKNNDTPSRKPDGESTDHESETPEYEDNLDNEDIPEHYDSLDQKQTDEHNMLDENEPERRSNEEINKTNDIDPQNYGSNQPNKKVRRHRSRNDPNYDQEISEEFDTIEEEKDESPVVGKNIDTPSRNPDGGSTDHESETPEYEDIAENKEIPENDGALDRNQANEHEVIDENEPERRSNEEINKSNEFDQQTDDDYAPNKKMRRQRKRRDPKDGQEISDEYDAVEEREDESPVASKNNDTPSRKPDGESTDHESETPEYEDNLDNEDIPEHYDSLDQKQTDEHNMLDENEPERRSNEEINKTNDIDPQNYGSNQPNKKVRRHRSRNDPNYDQEISEEFDTIEEEKDEPQVFDKNYNTLPGEPEYITEHVSDTPENEEIPEYNQSNENVEISELEPDHKTNKEKNIPKEIADQNNAGNQPNKKIRHHRQRKDPLHSHEISEEYETIEDENDEINKLETPNMDSYDKFDKNPISSPNYKNNANDENNLVNPPKNKPKRFRNRKNPEYDHEISEEYDSLDNYNEEAKLKKHTFRPEINDENRDLNNNVIPNIDNDVSKDVLNTGHDEQTVVPQTIFEENNEAEPDATEHPENAAPEASLTNDVDETMNVSKPRPRKVRRHKEPRQPKTVNEKDNEPEIVNDDNNVQEELPETENGETTDVNNEIEQPGLSEYPENADIEPEASYPKDVDETTNVAKPRPRKVRRRKKPRHPKTVNERDNEPEVVNDDNNVREELPETENGETTDVNNEIEQPGLSEYPENSDIEPEASYPNDFDETTNVAKPRPRKVRRRKKPRHPKTVNKRDNEPEVVNDDNNVREELPETENGETTDVNNEIEQPGLSEYPENSEIEPEASYPNDVDETTNVAKPRPRKVRRRKKPRHPKTVNERDNEPEVVNDDNNVREELPETENGETTDINNEIEQPELSEYPENADVPPETSYPNDVDETTNVAKPRPRKVKRHKKPRQPKTVNERDNEPEEVNDDNNVREELPETENGEMTDINNEIEQPEISGGTINTKEPRRRKHVRRKKMPTTVDEITPNNLDTENRRIQNDDKSVENPETQPNDTGRNPKKKRRLRRIRTYMVNKATNERIPINDQTYSTTDGLPDTPKNKLEATEIEDSDDTDSNEDNDDYSSFLFKEYNSDQCKRDAYDRFKKVTSQDAKQIAYRSVLDTSEMRSNMLATIKNAIGNVKDSKTLNDVDKSLRTVSYSLKTGLKQTVSDLVTKVIPLAKDFLKTAENLKELYNNGPQSTHKMLSNILENESTVPDSAKDVLKLISPQFDVDELINNIFEKPFNTKSLKEKKAKAQRKLISLSKHMDTAISNIDCFVLSAMSAVGIGADTLKLLKSGRVIMSDKHPRAKALRDAMGIIKAGKKIRNNDVDFTPTLTSSDGFTESDEDDDDEDPDEVAQKNEEFLKTVPDLDDNIPVPKKVPNKRQSLGVIVVHPDKQIEYKEVTDTSQLKKFVGDQTKKYKLQSKNHPKFLKLNSKKLIDNMVADVKKKAERNGMSKKEMVEEIIKNLKSS